MNSILISLISIATLTGISCALPGTFLMIRNVGMMSDAISHALLPGIVLMFLVTGNLNSPLLLLGASLMGIVTVLLIEQIIQKKRLQTDAAIGFVFPLLFSIGILLICTYTRTVHLDTDMVIIGELAFTPFHRLTICGIDLGPTALWNMGFLATLNALLTYLFWKELSFTTFDQTAAQIAGFSPRIVYFCLMTIASITIVSAFSLVGSIIVVTLTLAPPATASLLTRRLSHIIGISCFLCIASTCVGYLGAHWADVSIAGSIAATHGLFFLLAALCAPKTGVIGTLLFYRHTDKELATLCVLQYCTTIHDKPNSKNIAQTFGWSYNYTKKILNNAQQKQWIQIDKKEIHLTPLGAKKIAAYCRQFDSSS